jgi:DNA-directed RNA polymerase subunit RPC12/RpoP
VGRVSSAAYTPRAPTAGVVYQVVREHYETFRAAATQGDACGLPRFVDDEFRGLLRCGFLAGGFARFRCVGCGWDRLVPFSCKSRAVCPSCGGRRMAERAAHLVDHVFPAVPIRQWVLSLPYRLRYLLAWDHDLCRAVSGVFVRVVLGSLRRRARRAGAPQGRGGAVAILQRFGAALNLNVHVHALVLDGVYVEQGRGGLRFQTLPAPPDAEMDGVLLTLVRRLERLLARRGLAGVDDEGEDQWRDESPVLAGMAAAAVQGRRALGARAGAAVARMDALGGAPVLGEPGLGPCHARWAGYDLHAAVVVPAHDRDRLERVCRYALRPPVSDERLQRRPDGRIVLELRHRWSDGTTHLAFEPVELLERLAALTPRPRVNLLFYYGVLGARAAWRRRIVPAGGASSMPAADTRAPGRAAPATAVPRRNMLWAELMQRSFGLDVLACPRCGDRLVLIALIEDSRVVRRILGHLGLPTEVPAVRPPRSPPLPQLRSGDEPEASGLTRAADGAADWLYDPDIDVP